MRVDRESVAQIYGIANFAYIAVIFTNDKN